ncbi:acetyltransferase [Achromobacter sp. HZ01]|jgi:ribosomal protein S18 acetylase RimI-like enzyme|uniref:GNAT family N-acetyltransferase n=1 Tax=Achromobacter pulmonis TaxID=1389932 RepID=A0A2N8KGW8_9BURK|nr:MULTISPECIES: GNAT family N-acetyltransferase [Achromobacter]PND32695.1 GNAT family N-acetyltransferase [Achromobacter pulmonis]RAP62917.1 acetyltransferase [Achromobacter sp. HZ01]
MPESTYDLTLLPADAAETLLADLAELLRACVQDGASVGFVLPYAPADAQAYWRAKVLPGVAAGTLALWVARLDGRVAGSVQLDCDMPPNQPHRAELRKLLVHPDFRRRGLARALLREAEAMAARRGRSLITLDTRTGDKAEPLYASAGYRTAGRIPGFSRDPRDPSRLDATTVMYKQL